MNPSVEAERLLAVEVETVEQALTPSACMLYALSIGLAQGPEDDWALPFVYEKGLRVFPTMATVVGRPASWMRWPELAFLGPRLLQGAQSLALHRPMRPAETVVSKTRMVELVDKGAGRGAVLIVERALSGQDGEPIATLHWTVFCRGAGGFGGASEQAFPRIRKPPEHLPTRTIALTSRPDAALVYRLNGDMNPIHADPQAAKAAGLGAPVLHGLQMYGAVAAVVLREAGLPPEALAGYDMRFSGVTYPGERLEIDLWDADDGLALAVRCPDREVMAADAGFLRLKR